MLFGLHESGCGYGPCSGRYLDFDGFRVDVFTLTSSLCDFCLARCRKIHEDFPGVLFERGSFQAWRRVCQRRRAGEVIEAVEVETLDRRRSPGLRPY